jgi:protein-disulfide isomerase
MASSPHWKPFKKIAQNMPKLTPPINQHDHIQGLGDAPITLLEYGDYQCPHCAAAYPIIKEIQKIFSKKLRFAFRNFPLANIHEFAIPAALAAEAAGRQDKYWEMHDFIFEHQAKLSKLAFIEFAQMLKLNIAHFKMDFQDKKLEQKIEEDFESGVRSGVNGTPSFYINQHKYDGSYDFGSMAETIKGYLQPAL